MSDLNFGAKAGIPAGTDGGEAGEEGARGEGAPIRSPLSNPSVGQGEDDVDRSLRPRTLAEFIGQPRVREQLRVFIDAARGRDEALDHALFAGPPGLGKCVTPDTILLTTHGMVPIGSLGDLQGDSWQPITRPLAGLYGTRTADYFYNNGDGDTLRVTTAAGYRIEGTPNHPVLVRGGDRRMRFCRLSELRRGDEVAVRIGAQVFGSSTRLGVEGINAPSLADPAVVPDELTAELARLLGMLLGCGRLSPGGDGVVAVTRSPERAAELERLCKAAFCLAFDSFGEGPLGARYGQRSPRVAALLAGLGMGRRGFEAVPEPVFRAPRLLVAEFLRGVFWGVEHAPTCTLPKRTMVAHLQLMLANFGIESRIAPAGEGWVLRAAAEPSRYYGGAAGSFFGQRGAGGEQPRDQPHEVGFGMTPAGVLVALGTGTGVPGEAVGYRRGRVVSADITPVTVVPGTTVTVAAGSGASVSVAEVEPSERGRALTREHVMRHDVRALAVRSVTSQLRPNEVVELVYEAVVSIDPGQAHTCDVSVPDGHTFIGNGIVCHNTTLASVVANELGSTMHQTSGPALEKKADVAAILTSLGPRDVLFIDEIHRLNTAIEEVLYSAMEDYQIDIVLGQGPAARTLRLDLEPFTLVGATTRTGLLTTPLRDRFGLIQRLEYYDADELHAIVLRSARLLGIQIDADAAVEIAGRSRGTPRIANRLLRRVRDVAQVRHAGAVTLDIAREALDLVDIDGIGLDRVDRLILEAILTKFGGGPVGLGTLSVSLGEEPHTIEDVYEPFLLQLGMLQRTPRGRIITELGRRHLGAVAAASRSRPMFGRGGSLF